MFVWKDCPFYVSLNRLGLGFQKSVQSIPIPPGVPASKLPVVGKLSGVPLIIPFHGQMEEYGRGEGIRDC